MPFTTSRWSGTTATRRLEAAWTGCSARICAAIPLISSCAAANVAPSRSRANAVQPV